METTGAARERLLAFVRDERERRPEDEGNILAVGYATRVADLLQYLELTAAEYASAAEAFHQLIARREAIRSRFPPGKRVVGEDELALLYESREAAVLVHLRVETFYLWAKILLDVLARAIPQQFGPARGVKLQKHSHLKNGLRTFAEQHGLTVPPSLTERIDDLTRRVSDYRDHLIAHSHDPRILRGTTFDHQTREASISTGMLYPRDDSEMIRPAAETPTVLLPVIEGYVVELVDFLESRETRAGGVVEIRRGSGPAPP